MPCPICKKEHDFTVEEALNRLEKGPEEVRVALAGAGHDELNWAPPGAWSPHQVVTHLLDTELVFGTRYRKILAGDEGELAAFDQERWTAACSAGRNLAHVLTTFEYLRQDNVALLRIAALSDPTSLDRAGRHPEFGRLTLRDLVLHISPHDMNHAGQIRRTREQYKNR